MIIRQADSSDEGNWDAYVQNHPEAAAYHLWAWKESIRVAYKHEGHYLIAEDHGHIQGIFPLVHIKMGLLHNQLVALPFCDIGGPLADSQDVSSLLLAEALLLAKKLGANKLEVRTRCSSPFNDSSSLKTEKLTNKVSLVLRLPGSSQELWSGFKSKLRSQILKAEKNGLSFRWGQCNDIDEFYEVFSKNMHELGSPVHSKTWIQSVLTNYGERARIGLVIFEEKAVGCGIILLCGKTVAIPWASTLRNFNRLSPNMLLYWKFLDFSVENNFDIFDFGRSTPEEGTYRFKLQWGAAPQMLYWTTVYPQDQGGGTSAAAHLPSYINRKNLALLWTKLPLCAANVLGPHLRRYISL